MKRRLICGALQVTVSGVFGYLFARQVLDDTPDSATALLLCFIGTLTPIGQLQAVVAAVMRRQLRVFPGSSDDSEGG